MADTEVFEGTWEELAAQAEALKGRKLRLMVLPESVETKGTDPDELRLRETAKRLFQEADHTKRTPGQSHHKPHQTVVGEMIAEKYQKMGLTL